MAWEDIRCWAEMNVFLSARREGWLDAIRYFSDMLDEGVVTLGADGRGVAAFTTSPVSHASGMGQRVASVSQLSNADSAARP